MNPLNSSTDGSRFSILENSSTLLDLEQQGHFLLGKNQLLENQLQETRIKLQAVIFSKIELEKVLEKERTELKDTKEHLKILQGTLQYWERERFNEKNSSVMQSIQLEISQKEKNLLNEQLKFFQFKNAELTVQVEELQKQLRSQKDMENLLHSSKNAFEATVEKIYCESEKLEKELNCLKNQVTLSKHAGEQMTVLLKHHHEALNTVYEENESLKKSSATHAGELHLEKSARKIGHEGTTQNGIDVETLQKQLKEKEKMLFDLNRELSLEVEEKKKLKEMVNNMLSDQMKSNQMTQYLRSCISRLEKQLEKKAHVDATTN